MPKADEYLQTVTHKYSGVYSIGSKAVVDAIDELVESLDRDYIYDLPPLRVCDFPGFVEQVDSNTFKFENGTLTMGVSKLRWYVRIRGTEVFAVPKPEPDYSRFEGGELDLTEFHHKIGELDKEVIDMKKEGLSEVFNHRYYFKEELKDYGITLT